MRRRELTAGEARVLAMIQEGYGAQNSVEQVFFSHADEAAIFVKAADGTSPLLANLTNLAAMRADSTIASEEALKRDWLKLK